MLINIVLNLKRLQAEIIESGSSGDNYANQ